MDNSNHKHLALIQLLHKIAAFTDLYAEKEKLTWQTQFPRKGQPYPSNKQIKLQVSKYFAVQIIP